MSTKSLPPKIHRKEIRTESGFIYHRLTFSFKGKGKMIRYVTDDIWKARLADAHSAWVVWHAVKDNKEPSAQMTLL